MSVTLAILMAAQAVAPTPAPMPAFLAGCWTQRQAERWTEECWTTAEGGVMLGSGRSGTGDTVRQWEWMRIERRPDGALAFYASPNGAPAVAFAVSDARPDAVTFVNAAHDYPQRIRYWRSPAGLEAETALADGSRPQRWTFKRR